MTSIVVHGLTITVGKGTLEGLTKVGVLKNKDVKQNTSSLDMAEVETGCPVTASH